MGRKNLRVAVLVSCLAGYPLALWEDDCLGSNAAADPRDALARGCQPVSPPVPDLLSKEHLSSAHQRLLSVLKGMF